MVRAIQRVRSPGVHIAVDGVERVHKITPPMNEADQDRYRGTSAVRSARATPGTPRDLKHDELDVDHRPDDEERQPRG